MELMSSEYEIRDTLRINKSIAFVVKQLKGLSYFDNFFRRDSWFFVVLWVEGLLWFIVLSSCFFHQDIKKIIKLNSQKYYKFENG